jgi:hypothetical protein
VEGIKMKNLYLLKDADSNNFEVDIAVITNENKETIINTVNSIKQDWYKNDCSYDLLEAIVEVLNLKYNVTIFVTPIEVLY